MMVENIFKNFNGYADKRNTIYSIRSIQLGAFDVGCLNVYTATQTHLHTWTHQQQNYNSEDTLQHLIIFENLAGTIAHFHVEHMTLPLFPLEFLTVVPAQHPAASPGY